MEQDIRTIELPMGYGDDSPDLDMTNPIDREAIKVEVTEKHIRDGNPYDSESCPIALALTDLGFEDVRVDDEIVCWRKGVQFFRAVLTNEGMDFVDRFDSRLLVTPISLELIGNEIDGYEEDEDEDEDI